MKIGSINHFLKKKYRIKLERKQTEVIKNIITIDGVDGAGKDLLAINLRKELLNRFPERIINIIDITHFSGSPKLNKLGSLLKAGRISKKNMDNLYTASLNRAYDEIVLPRAQKGEVIIIPRSEVNLLRFAIEDDNKSMILKRHETIQNGTMSYITAPGNRVFLDVKPMTQLRNLVKRGNLSQYDPKNLMESKSMITSQEKVKQYFIEHRLQGQNFIIIHNEFVQDIFLKDYFNNLSKVIADKTNLGLN